MNMAGRIPADQVVDARVWKLPSWDGAKKKFKVQKRKAGRFTREERRARKRTTQLAMPDCDQSDCDQSGCAQPEIVSDLAAVEAADAGIAAAEQQRESDAVQTDAITPPSDPPADAVQQGREEGYEAGKAEGREAGLQLGIEQGRKQFAEEVKQKIDTLDALINQLQHPMMHEGEDLGESIARLIMEVSRRVVLRELALDEKQIINVVLKALDALPHGAQLIKIFLTPVDIQIIEQMAQVTSGQWQLIEDANLSPGGCRIETSTSFIDYTLEKRFNDCLDAVFGADVRLPVAQGDSRGLAPQLKSADFTGSNTASVSSSIVTDRSPTGDSNDEA